MNMIRSLWPSALLTLALRTSLLVESKSAQLRCFSVTGSHAMDTHLIYYAYITAPDLYKRDDTKLPLQNCSTESGPLELDTCRVCLRGGVIAECYLSHPSAELRFEAVTSDKQLNKTQIPCVSTTTMAPTAPTTHSADPPSHDAQIVGGVLGGLCFLVAVATVAYCCWKNKSCMTFSSHKAVPKTDPEDGLNMTPKTPAANGHAAASPDKAHF